MSHSTEAIEYNKRDLPSVVGGVGWAVLALGLVTAGISFAVDPLRAKFVSIMLFMLLAGIGSCALFMVAIEYIAGAVWSTPLRRIFEIVASSMMFLIIFALPVLFFMDDIYVWLDPSHIDEILTRKLPYLNKPFFMVRTAVVLGLWFLFYKLFTGRSYKQDETKDQDLTRKNIKMSALFIPVFGLSITALAIDYLMTLEPHWFSTIFGVNFFAGSLVTCLAVVTIASVLLNENGYLMKGIVGDHYYSLGFGMFAGCVFWMYTAFSQGMLIWYANLPEETPWFINRWDGGWKVITIALIVVHFIIPLFGLIQRKNKRNPNRMLFMSCWVIFAHLLDLYWIVMPAYSHKANLHGPTLSFVEFGFLAIGVGFMIVLFNMQAKKKNLVAIGDPKLQRGLNFRL